MAPNTRSSGGNVCVDDSRTAFDAAAFDVAANSALRASPAASAGPPTQHKHDDVVIFFDWDDTLMASSAIAKLGLCPKFVHEKPAIPADVALELAALEVAVVELLDLALVRGRVVIVTAAETGWVELSAALFMPRVVPLLNTHIKVVSARSTYEYLYPDCPRRWKIEAFNHEVFPAWELYSDESDGIDPTTLPRHVISLGDGPTEREALINVKMQALDACFGKSMKFITYPKIHELRLEVELIVANFEYLVAHDGDLDLQITWEMLNNANANTNTNSSSSNNNASGA